MESSRIILPTCSSYGQESALGDAQQEEYVHRLAAFVERDMPFCAKHIGFHIRAIRVLDEDDKDYYGFDGEVFAQRDYYDDGNNFDLRSTAPRQDSGSPQQQLRVRLAPLCARCEGELVADETDFEAVAVCTFFERLWRSLHGQHADQLEQESAVLARVHEIHERICKAAVRNDQSLAKISDLKCAFQTRAVCVRVKCLLNETLFDVRACHQLRALLRALQDLLEVRWDGKVKLLPGHTQENLDTFQRQLDQIEASLAEHLVPPPPPFDKDEDRACMQDQQKQGVCDAASQKHLPAQQCKCVNSLSLITRLVLFFALLIGMFLLHVRLQKQQQYGYLSHQMHGFNKYYQDMPPHGNYHHQQHNGGALRDKALEALEERLYAQQQRELNDIKTTLKRFEESMREYAVYTAARESFAQRQAKQAADSLKSDIFSVLEGELAHAQKNMQDTARSLANQVLQQAYDAFEDNIKIMSTEMQNRFDALYKKIEDLYRNQTNNYNNNAPQIKPCTEAMNTSRTLHHHRHHNKTASNTTATTTATSLVLSQTMQTLIDKWHLTQKPVIATQARFKASLATYGVAIRQNGHQVVAVRPNSLEVAFLDENRLQPASKKRCMRASCATAPQFPVPATRMVRLKAQKLGYISFIGVVTEKHFASQYAPAPLHTDFPLFSAEAVAAAQQNGLHACGKHTSTSPKYGIDTSRMMYLSSKGHVNPRYEKGSVRSGAPFSFAQGDTLTVIYDTKRQLFAIVKESNSNNNNQTKHEHVLFSVAQLFGEEDGSSGGGKPHRFENVRFFVMTLNESDAWEIVE